MFFYHAHGLSIQSCLPFSEMVETKYGSDVEITFSKLDTPHLNLDYEKTLKRSKILVKNKQTYLFWDNICICKISAGRKIVINNSTEIEENLLKTIILGPAFAILLNQRDRLVLHASAVNINNSAVVFIGPKGRGKSTTSLAFCKKDHNLISDDILSIEFNNGLPLSFSSFPRIKLLPEVIHNIGEDPESLPKVYFNSNKRSYDLSNFTQMTLPLKAIYLIEVGNETRIEQMNSQTALIELIKSSFCFKFFSEKGLVKNFNQCSQIAKNVPIKKLKVKRSLTDLPILVETVQKDLKYQ